MTAALAFAAALIVGLAVLYNRLVRLRTRVQNAFAQIDVQLRRRHDLIPNLVESVRATLAHERGTLEGVVAARAGAVRAQDAARPADASSMGALAAAEGALSGALGRLMAVVEAYPTLVGDAATADLRESLTSTENRVAFARQAYNDAATELNEAVEAVPGLLIARPLGFRPAALLHDVSPEIHAAPRVALA